ncbi:putative F-box/FBD/LRR-repeat protein At5g56810 isoform X1 [Rosa chinensis]|uniref:putative F-box/FBD/LRR-repeat protein At5g56810 isoform X1 n=1 Tax=Rosa chinensis TaxID=74649 RepID=UPI001AD935EE|nr:putative F-box/FBD/LRR-repeat protein At5g56810 isoform X1 [Rosa chinensis]
MTYLIYPPSNMAKRRGNRTQSTCGKQNKLPINLVQDCISVLPDEVLVLILSLLSIKEAVSTCILSKRWKNVWKQITCLNFFLDELSKTEKIKIGRQVVEIPRTYNWVNQVLQLHQGQILDEFKLCSSSIDCDSTSEIDSWIELVIQKKVRKFEIDLQGDRGVAPYCSHYTFPENLFRNPFGVSWFSWLTHLSLNYVNITSELVEHFISNCQLLEHLFIAGSEYLEDLKVVGELLRLKFLQICDCLNLFQLEISAPCLETFFYDGECRYNINIRVTYAPLLAKICITEDFLFDSTTGDFQLFWNYLPQLVTLRLVLEKEPKLVPEFPELTSLEFLSLSIARINRRSLLLLTSLIEGSPYLHRFKLRLRRSLMGCRHRRSKVISEANTSPHQCLKVVELSGFSGSKHETEVARYLIKKAVALKKLIIDLDSKRILEEINPLRPLSTKIKELEMARKHALLLEKKLPLGGELIVL